MSSNSSYSSDNEEGSDELANNDAYSSEDEENDEVVDKKELSEADRNLFDAIPRNDAAPPWTVFAKWIQIHPF